MRHLLSKRHQSAARRSACLWAAIGFGSLILIEPAHAQLSAGCNKIDGLSGGPNSDVYWQQINNVDNTWNSGETIRATWTNPTVDPDTANLLAGASAGGGNPATVAQTTSAELTGASSTVLSLTLSAGRTYVNIKLDNGNGDWATECGLLQTITFNQPADQTLGSDASLTATASSGLEVSFTSNTPGVCTVAGVTVTPQSTGTCTITSTQAGGGIYYPAENVTKSLAIKATQAITFNQPAELTLGDDVDLTATASSDLDVSYTSSTTDVCTVASNTVTSQSAGTCTITASQAGDPHFLAAADVARSFAISDTGPSPDTDGDGDSDSDRVKDSSDNCPFISNANQLDTDGDDIGDACEPVQVTALPSPGLLGLITMLMIFGLRRMGDQFG